MDSVSKDVGASGKGRILVVDDDRLVLATLTHGLAQAGYEVLDADNGDDAILIARQHRPDLALLDIRMEGMTGFDVAGYLRDYLQLPFMFLSAFADEAANRKTAIEQMAALAALGLKYYSPRFVDVTGEGTVEHVVDLTDDKLSMLRDIHAEYGMSVASIGSRIGKVKLVDQDDGTHNRYVPFEKYLETEIASTIRAARL